MLFDKKIKEMYDEREQLKIEVIDKEKDLDTLKIEINERVTKVE